MADKSAPAINICARDKHCKPVTPETDQNNVQAPQHDLIPGNEALRPLWPFRCANLLKLTATPSTANFMSSG